MKDPAIVGVATMAGREEALEKMMKSLKGQCNEIVVYNNAVEKIDLSDNGKFYGLAHMPSPCYYLPCDDDLEYPPTYVQDMIEAIDRLGCIVTHHGKILKGKGVSYYRGGHTAFRCLDEVTEEREIDVAGTGVCGFHTSYFNPSEIDISSFKRMSDLVFSRWAAQEKKKIMILKHPAGYIKHLPIDQTKTIFATERNNDKVQSSFADDIYDLRHPA